MLQFKIILNYFVVFSAALIDLLVLNRIPSSEFLLKAHHFNVSGSIVHISSMAYLSPSAKKG